MTRQLTEEELQAWQRLVGDIAPVAALSNMAETVEKSVTPMDSLIYQEPKARPISTQPREIEAAPLQGLPRLNRKRLAQGKQLPEAVLDLHGYTQEQAQSVFEQFLSNASAQDKRLLCVITGYGRSTQKQGVLKKALPIWVNLPHNQRLIVEFAHAPLKLGGQGAWLIRLKPQAKVSR